MGASQMMCPSMKSNKADAEARMFHGTSTPYASEATPAIKTPMYAITAKESGTMISWTKTDLVRLA
ncbi:hypothetical protein BTJ68_13552 [Hortaea werneckii EXF-2000]|uniref:Uncharacterized protein n=1 Tax=Hortaea werneckii EXF-2000 TaxID=1157616 RepID=A0A1Z5SSB9_HORWE|nr:hypothetical protein BTJ68_13552 [Hortaea werneckii EXF-2000]